MSAGPVSLESALRTCKVDVAYANKVESDRFLNPDNMMCPVWNGVDLAGRGVCKDSFYTKRAGCNSALDRVNVENFLRPSYVEYITLDASGFEANIYGNTMPRTESVNRVARMKDINKVTGQFGNQFAEVYPSCGYYPYKMAMAQVAAEDRQAAGANNGYNSAQMRARSGF